MGIEATTATTPGLQRLQDPIGAPARVEGPNEAAKETEQRLQAQPTGETTPASDEGVSTVKLSDASADAPRSGRGANLDISV